jgi:DICT domain-containing protein
MYAKVAFVQETFCAQKKGYLEDVPQCIRNAPTIQSDETRFLHKRKRITVKSAT